MKNIIISFFLLIINFTCIQAQELFPSSEPASTMPKGVIGIRGLYETFKELPSQRAKNWEGVRLMYGLTGKLTLMLSGSASNHHFSKFPNNLYNYFINHHNKSYLVSPYQFEGVNLYARYRILSLDREKKHFRIALISEVSKSFIPHDGAEPNLMGDNSGIGLGFVITQLYKRFAASFTSEVILPFQYKDTKQQLTFKSGNSWNNTVSLGYRLFPIKYKSYETINVNVYSEFVTKSYSKAIMTLNGVNYSFEPFKEVSPYIYSSLQGNYYTEFRPALQFILNSNTRIDVGIVQPLVKKSYLHFYPTYFFHIQRYFYSKK